LQGGLSGFLDLQVDGVFLNAVNFIASAFSFGIRMIVSVASYVLRR
jgi:hypothetical protein